MLKKTIIVIFGLLLLTGCGGKPKHKEKNYTQDTIRTMLTDKKKNMYIFVGDKFTYIFKNNNDQYGTKMTYMFELMKNAKSWQFRKEPYINEYWHYNKGIKSRKQSISAIISVELIPNEQQLNEFENINPNYKEKWRKAWKKKPHPSYYRVKKNLNGYKSTSMYYGQSGCFLGICKNEHYRFDFAYSNVQIIKTTQKMKNKYSKYLLLKPIKIGFKRHTPKKLTSKKHSTIEKVTATGIFVAYAAVLVPITGLGYIIGGGK